MAASKEYTTLEVCGRELRISSPGRVFPPEPGLTKLDLVHHDLEHSVRAVPDAKVSCPLRWDEVADVEAGDLRIDTVPARLREAGDPAEAMDDVHHSLDPLLGPARREEEGPGDAPWPPHFARQRGEPGPVQPGRARRES